MINKNTLNFLKKLKTEKKIIDYTFSKENMETACLTPFYAVEIHNSGEVYTCCPNYIRHNAIGNINENSLTEIWNGKKAQELRERIKKSDYSMCDLDLCRQYIGIDASILPEKCPMPKHVVLSYDRECNLSCITCRDVKHKNTERQNEIYNKRIDELLPVLKEAEIIEISGAGEAFYSKHSRLLIKRIAAENKQAQFKIFTNGLLFNKANIKALGIEGRIFEAFISLPALDRTIYDKIMRGNDYNVVMKNLKEIFQEKTIKKITLNMVVSVLNYEEIPKLAEFAAKNNVNLSITQFYPEDTEFCRDYKHSAVREKTHSEFNKFKQILKHPALDYDKIEMTPLLKKIRETA